MKKFIREFREFNDSLNVFEKNAFVLILAMIGGVLLLIVVGFLSFLGVIV